MTTRKLEIICGSLVLLFMGIACWHCATKTAAAHTGPVATPTTGIDWSMWIPVICAVISSIPLLIPAVGQFIKDMGSKDYKAAQDDAKALTDEIKQLQKDVQPPAPPAKGA